MDEDNAARSQTLDNLLEGKAAGVQLITNGGEPDSGISVCTGLETSTRLFGEHHQMVHLSVCNDVLVLHCPVILLSDYRCHERFIPASGW